uniref:YDG/SRA domain-containing protein n=1 Tax=Pedobacter schmidteae TaxID=2201271 RepID=UPI000EB41FE3|nr:YDG/SRA domain-containing protein [Pedobacter schmidteae]
MTNIVFGEIEGFNEGYHFEDRKSMMANGFHRKWAAGIDGNGNEGTAAIVLSGGYEDDEDSGNIIIYTGAGGNKNGKQVEDQSWDNLGNAGLVLSMNNGLPVRVIRGHKHRSPFSPKSGYTYAGLYYVTKAWEAVGKSGYKICKFELVYSGSQSHILQVNNQGVLSEKAGELLVLAAELPQVSEVNISLAINSLIKPVKPKSESRSIDSSYNNFNSKKSIIHGNQGELLVMQHLRKTLTKVEASTLRHHAAENEKDGYDISYTDLNGDPVYIEVKATSAASFPSFIITINELTSAERYGAAYHVYLVNKVTSKDVKIELVKDIAGLLDKGDFLKSPVAFKVEKVS